MSTEFGSHDEIFEFISLHGIDTKQEPPLIFHLMLFQFEAVNRIKPAFEQTTNEHRSPAAAIE